jgi:hypothetical protein
VNIDPSIDMPARGGLLTGEMLHAAYRVAVPARQAEHATKQETTDLDTRRAELAWEELSPQGQTLYQAMADWPNVNALVSALAHLHAQIAQMTETLLRIEQERDAWQQLAGAHGIQTATPVPTATMLLEQERADFHTRMREMGIPFQEDGDHA